MNFILQMSLRELRSSWKRMLFFFLCISIGVASIVALRSAINNIGQAVTGEARQVLTADIQIDSERPWKEEIRTKIEAIANSPVVEAKCETIEASTMLRPVKKDGASTIELKGIEPPFPLVGDFKLVDGGNFSYQLLSDNGAVVSQTLLDKLDLKIGDKVRLGEAVFEIRAAFEQEPGGGGNFRLGPRVFIDRSSVTGTGLTGFGNRARRKIYLRTREGEMESVMQRLQNEIKGNYVTIRSYKDSQESLNEQFTRAENFLSLTGFIILVLGGIGVSNVTRVFIEQKKKTIAVLKCIGGKGNKIITVYLTQVLSLGLAGSLFGLLLAAIIMFFVKLYFADNLPPTTSYNLRTSAIIQGLGIGLLVSLIFSALPLLRIKLIKPSILLRNESDPSTPRFGLLRVSVAVLMFICLVVLAAWQAGSLLVGAYFLTGLAVTAVVLQLAATLLMRLLSNMKHLRSFALKQAVNSLYRPGNQTRVVVMAVGLGVFFVIAIQSLQTNLVEEIDFTRRQNSADMFLIDIQSDQAEGVKTLIKERTGIEPKLVPTIRARIVAINNQEFDLTQNEIKRDRGRLGREYIVTYRPNLESNEKIIAGKFWDATSSVEPEISVEESMRGLLGLDLNGEMTFDIQGRKLIARVTSFRKVDWRNSRTGFMILFRPGALDKAPQTMVAAINGPTNSKDRVSFQRALVDKYPNVSAIDVLDIVKVVKRIINNITLAVSFVGGFVVLSGILILAGSIAMTKFQRIYEAAVLKTLGAKRKVILTILLFEYGLLGSVAGLIGSIAATGLSFVLAKYVFKISWTFIPSINITGLFATIFLVIIVGMLASISVITQKPLSILRGQ